MVVHVSKATQAQPIEWFLTAEPVKRGDDKLVEYLRDLGCATVGEVVDRQDEIKSEKLLERIKVKLGFEMLGVKPAK